jgi:hypothetical protein
MAKYRTSEGHEVEKGKYSLGRTERGNILIGRRKGKSKVRVLKDMISLSNLHKGRRLEAKWDRTAEREAESIKKTI